MIKKFFVILIALNVILINIILENISLNTIFNQDTRTKVVDIKKTNGLIKGYSNLVLEIVPANE